MPRKSNIEHAKWQKIKAEIDAMVRVNLPGTWTKEDYREFIALFAEHEERKKETIILYKPLPTAQKFHECMDHEVALSGSNRAGKTCTASGEVGYAATGKHPVQGKYPESGIQIACVGNDGRHLSLMYEYLFEKAQFKIFKNPETFEWTVVNENLEEHTRHKDLWIAADPIIPERYIRGGIEKGVSWENQKEKIPKSVSLINGGKIRFYSGLVRKMPQGRKFHLVWMDEELDHPKRWIDEMRARIVDFNGRIFWSATPQNATDEFLDFEMRAEDPENAKKPLSERTAYFLMLQEDNIYLSRQGSKAFEAKMKMDTEQYRTRWQGQSARSYLLAYPEFKKFQHVVPEVNLRWEDTRYIIVDPGVEVAAVLFCIAPEVETNPDKVALLTEPERWYRTRPGCIVCYDELYIKQANPQLVAQLTKEKLDQHHQSYLREMIIDYKGGRGLSWKGMKEGETAESVYMENFQKFDINPVVPGWQYGSHDIRTGIERTKDYLVPQVEDRLPMLFIASKCEKLIWEFGAWRKKRNALGEFIGYEDGRNHLLDCVRYATTRGLPWVPPPNPVGPKPFGAREYGKLLSNIRSGKAFFQ